LREIAVKKSKKEDLKNWKRAWRTAKTTEYKKFFSCIILKCALHLRITRQKNKSD
jgi:hypothetical protein